MRSGKEAGNQREDLAEMIGDHAQKKREKRNYYRNFLLLNMTAFLSGVILEFFRKSLGFGGFLFGAILLLLGFSFAQIIEKL